MEKRQKVRVLFVCMGNICRSPTAEGIFRHLIRNSGDDLWIEVDSAGTHAYHVGEKADGRARKTARARGIEMEDLRARKVDFGDFYQADIILAMDQDNYHNLLAMAPEEAKDKIFMMMDFAPDHPALEVPDPYYGGPEGFERVFDMLEEAAQGLLKHLKDHFT